MIQTNYFELMEIENRVSMENRKFRTRDLFPVKMIRQIDIDLSF